MPKSAFTEEQEAFLQEKVPGFRIAQGDVTVETYVQQVYAEFYQQWPRTEDGVTQRQIYYWFYNRREGKSKKSSTKGRVIDLTKAAKKIMQGYQAYYRLYKEELTPELNARWEAMVAKLPKGAKKPDRFGFNNKIVRAYYREEDDAVKAYCERYRHSGEEIDGDDDDAETARMNKRRIALQRIPKTIQVAAEAIERDTGWYVTMLLGGRDVDTDEVKSYIFHNGRTPGGDQWHQYEGCFEQIRSSWVEFIDECFPREEELPTQYRDKGKAVVASSSRQKSTETPTCSRATSVVASGASPGPSNRRINSAAVTEQERRVQHNLRILRGLGVDVDSHREYQKGSKGKARADNVEEDYEMEHSSENEEDVTGEGTKRSEGSSEDEDSEPNPRGATEGKAVRLEDEEDGSVHGDTPSRSPSRPPRRIRDSPLPTPSQVDSDVDAEESDDEGSQRPAPKAPVRSRKHDKVSPSQNVTQEDEEEEKTHGNDEDADAEPPQPRPPTRLFPDSSQDDTEQGRSQPPTPAPTNSKGNTHTINRAKKVYTSRQQQVNVAPPPVRSNTRPPARLATDHSKSRVVDRDSDGPTEASQLEDQASNSGPITVQQPRSGRSSRQRGYTNLPTPSDTAEASQPSPPRPSTSSQKLPVVPIAIPPGASEFTVKAAEYLFGISNDNTWVRLVNLWIRFEDVPSHTTGKQAKFTTKHRPEEIARFMQNHRNYSKVPSLAGLRLKPFIAGWKSWWRELQPAWRDTTDWPPARDHAPEGMDWECLRLGGPNGLYLAVVSLAWWFRAVLDKEPQQKKEVTEAMKDVGWVLNTLIKCADETPVVEKRKANANIIAQRAPSKRARK